MLGSSNGFGVSRRRVGSVACIAILAAGPLGCVNSPFWRYDRFDVVGEISGSTCQVTINGRPVPTDTAFSSDHVQIMVDYAGITGLAPGQGIKTVFCHGLQLSIASPVDLPPRPGEYRVTNLWGVPVGTASMSVFSPGITAGSWPLALTGVYLVGVDGTVQLDSISRDNAWAKFRFRAHRQHKSG